MAWMKTDYSKHTYFRWKIKWRLEHLGTLGIMVIKAPLKIRSRSFETHLEFTSGSKYGKLLKLMLAALTSPVNLKTSLQLVMLTLY